MVEPEMVEVWVDGYYECLICDSSLNSVPNNPSCDRSSTCGFKTSRWIQTKGFYRSQPKTEPVSSEFGPIGQFIGSLFILVVAVVLGFVGLVGGLLVGLMFAIIPALMGFDTDPFIMTIAIGGGIIGFLSAYSG